MNDSKVPRSILSQNKPWDHNDNSAWLATTIGISRNVEKFEFPGKLSQDRRKQIISLLGKELTSNSLLKNPVLYKAEELSSLEKEYLGEHFVSTLKLNQAHSGEALILDETGQFMAAINLNDHLHFVLLDIKGELENTLNRLIKIESALSNKINYCFSPKFGFLTADPMECGTALKMSVFLQLPGLVHTEQIDAILDKYADESITITGIQGNPTELIGDVIAIQNNYSLGVSEENLVSALRSLTTKLLVEENGARNNIRHSQSPDIKDKVSRAFAILLHSYHIETVEAMNALSLLKLGAEMGWIKGITPADLNQVFFNCRRAHLLNRYTEKISHEQIIHKRAEFIHESLKKVELKI